jgi:branched-subunit amino acid permease
MIQTIVECIVLFLIVVIGTIAGDAVSKKTLSNDLHEAYKKGFHDGYNMALDGFSSVMKKLPVSISFHADKVEEK